MNQKPTHFDLEPFKKALKSFLFINAESRSNMRTNFFTNKDQLISCFKDQHDENSFKRCVDVKEITGRLQHLGINMETQIAEHLDGLLTCFGDIDWEFGYGERVPPETEEQRKARGKLELWRANRAKTGGNEL